MNLRSKLLASAFLAAPAAFLACVGNDPVANNPISAQDAGGDGATTAASDSGSSSGDSGSAPSGLDHTFGGNGSIALSGDAVALTALPGEVGGLVWAENKGDRGVLHRLGLNGLPDETPPGFDFEVTPDPSNASETITTLAVAATGSGTPIVLVGGSGNTTDSTIDWWARGFDPTGAYAIIATTQPASQSGTAESLNAITFDAASGTILSVRTHEGSGGPFAILQSDQAANDHIGDNASGTAIAIDPSGGIIGAAVGRAAAGADANKVFVTRSTTPDVPSTDADWNSGAALSFAVDGGATGAGLIAESDGVLVAGLTRGSNVFFQKVDEGGHVTGAVAILPTSAAATGFAGAVKQNERIVIAGCVGGQAWVGGFTIAGGMPAYDSTFGTGGQLTISGASGECAKSVVVDGKGRLLLLVGTTPTTGGGASNRIVRLAL